LEGEPTSKTPRVPPAQSPGMTCLLQAAQPEATAAQPAAASALQLEAFVNDFVENLVSEVKSELTAEAQSTAGQSGITHKEAPLPFTEGSSAVSPSPQKAHSAAAKRTPNRNQSSAKRSLHKPALSLALAAQLQASDEQRSSSVLSTARQPETAGDASQSQANVLESQAESSQPQTELSQAQAASQASSAVPGKQTQTASSAETAAISGQANESRASAEGSQIAETLSAAVYSQAARSGSAAEDNQASQAATAIEYETEHADTVRSEKEHVDTVEVVHDLVQELLEAVARHGTPHKVNSATEITLLTVSDMTGHVSLKTSPPSGKYTKRAHMICVFAATSLLMLHVRKFCLIPQAMVAHQILPGSHSFSNNRTNSGFTDMLFMRARNVT
jgi:hypothetical protein